LYLKRLLVGGMPRVYEINRNFRNEGLDKQHNPEFTMLEAYQAYGNFETMMRLIERLIIQAARDVLGTTRLAFRGQAVDLSPPWEQASFAQAMGELGLSPASPLADIQAVLRERGLQVKGLTRSQMVRLTEQLFEPKTKDKPLFVTDYWTELSPLAKSRPDDPQIAERFELYIGGMEVANAYSELNDPLEQRRRFEAQVKGKAGKFIDEGFVEALEYGMPPAGGLGVGVDRLAMLLFDQPSIKDVILFPLLKPAAR
jgi:lysyl-tRNA synthetase class 2